MSQETVETSDTLHFNPAGALVYHDNNHATASYGAKDARQSCTFRALEANALILTHVEDSASCSMAP